MAEKAVSTVRSWLSRLNIKAPWRVRLGHASTQVLCVPDIVLLRLWMMQIIRTAC